MTVAVSRAKGAGAEAIICASTGNTAASCAAYAARAGFRGAVIVPEGKIAIGKLAQALMHGARVIALRGNFDQALEIVRELAERHPVELVNSVNPYRIEGQKTAAFEVCDELGGPPDALAIPVGNAGNVTAWWRGFHEYEAAPLLYGFQAEGAAPLVHGKPVRRSRDDRVGDQDRQPGSLGGGHGCGHRFTGEDRGGLGPADSRCLPPACLARGHLLRAGLRGVGRRDPGPRPAHSRRRRSARVGRLRAHRARPQGPRHRARQRAAVIGCEAELGAVEQVVFGDD